MIWHTGLPTSYRNFIDDYWVSIKTGVFEDDFIKFSYPNEYNNQHIKNFKDFRDFISNTSYKHYEQVYSDEYGNISLRDKLDRYGLEKPILSFKNNFFYLINQKNSENWVDIENEYYKLLKDYLKKESVNHKDEVENLNQEFEQVKNLLEKYLIEKVEKGYDFTCNDLLLNILNSLKINLKEFSNEDQEKITKEDQFDFKNYDSIVHSFKKVMQNYKTYFLNFNYTNTLDEYLKSLVSKVKPEINFIHGILANKTDNKINFGFGDEMDEDYKLIENLDDNEYLKNFKSFQYLQNQNYKHLLDFIDSEKFQVYIMGHSCGLSDRTLLNTVFEHNNCRSIKVFFHEYIDKDGNITGDNYTEIIQNISRHFNKKALMRSKIVNKTFCEPMPQIQLPKK